MKNNYVKLRIEGIDVYYKSYKALNNVSFEADPGEIISILGPNGSGKTTLLRTIAKILRPRRGVIYLDSKDIFEISDGEYSKIVGYLPQQTTIISPMKIFEIIALGRKPYVKWSLTNKDLEKIWEVIKLMGLESFVFREITELSGGERQRVLCARVLVQEPKILLLDEPTTHLDLRYQIEFLELFKKLTKENNLITIMALHDINLATRYSDKIILMKNGYIYAIGKPEEILTSETIREVFEVETEIIRNPELHIIIRGIVKR